MAFYWRAWNQRVLGRLPEARADIDIAKQRSVSGQIYTLAGMIAYDQEDLTPAEIDLKVALSLAEGRYNCEAMWYLGLVFMKRQEWPRAASEYEKVMGCYEARQDENEGFKRGIEARENLDPEFKARQLANFDAVIQESVSQRHAAAYNAAHFYARAGNLDKAKPLLEIAAKDPSLADRVAELKKLIGGGGSDTIASHGHLRALRNHARQLHR
jgi:tetratricopeptide (TPR) repeat protein